MAMKKRLQPMLAFMLILPRFFGGQIMVWWSTVLAQISAAAHAVFFAAKTQKSSYAKKFYYKQGEDISMNEYENQMIFSLMTAFSLTKTVSASRINDKLKLDRR